LRTATTALADAWRDGRSWLITVVGLQLVLASMPALQVVMVAQVLRALPESGEVWLPTLVLAVVVGLQFPLGQCATAASQRLALRTRHAYQMLALEHVSRSGPKALARPETVAGAQTAHEAADAVDRLAGDVIRLVGAAVTAVVLSVAVMGIDPAAGLLILCALAPTVLAFTRIAKAEEKGWPRIGAAARRAQYASEQLLQQRTGTELAALGSASKVVELARGRRREQMGVLDALIGVAMRWEAIAGGVTACLLTAALLILLLGQADGAGAAAALTGAISGLHAIRNVGYAAGAIVTAVPKMRAIDRCRETTVEEQPRVRAHSEELRARRVCVRYPGASADAVSDATITAERGEMIAIVGPNGAGKTTTLSMIAGLLPPSHGTVEVFGIDAWRDRAKAQQLIGILPDRLRMFDQLTGAQFLSYVGAVRGVKGETLRERMEYLLDDFGLRDEANRLVVDYSLGLRKKLALAATLIHAPKLLVLDEPFEAIDPVSAGTFIDVLNSYVNRGGTVVLSSHSMDLVQRVCDHVAVIAKGELLAEGTVDDVRGNVSLEERFRDLVRGPGQTEGLDWLEISFG
jgi:ABC-type multidrug transport system ATPase subunit